MDLYKRNTLNLLYLYKTWLNNQSFTWCSYWTSCAPTHKLTLWVLAVFVVSIAAGTDCLLALVIWLLVLMDFVFKYWLLVLVHSDCDFGPSLSNGGFFAFLFSLLLRILLIIFVNLIEISSFKLFLCLLDVLLIHIVHHVFLKHKICLFFYSDFLFLAVGYKIEKDKLIESLFLLWSQLSFQLLCSFLELFFFLFLLCLQFVEKLLVILRFQL